MAKIEPEDIDFAELFETHINIIIPTLEATRYPIPSLKGYEVYGLIRRASTFNTSRIDHLYIDSHEPGGKLFLYYGDLSEGAQLTNLLYDLRPDKTYHLGAQSHVRVSFDMPEYTGNITALGTTRILEAIKRSAIRTRFYQASSSGGCGVCCSRCTEPCPARSWRTHRRGTPNPQAGQVPSNDGDAVVQHLTCRTLPGLTDSQLHTPT